MNAYRIYLNAGRAHPEAIAVVFDEQKFLIAS